MTAVANDPFTIVRDLAVSGLRQGDPRTVGALTLMPLFGKSVAARYLTAAEGLAQGTLMITEVGGGRVPQLMVRNTGKRPVLLLDGELLEGAMQNRVVNASVLVAARRDTVIPVSCVERGRWAYASERRGFSSGTDIAYAELRAMKAQHVAAATRAGAGRRADQGAVWADVERKRAQVGGRGSATGAMRDAYDDRRRDLDAMLRAFPASLSGQTGVLAFVGSEPLALDAFDRSATLAQVWDRLVRGYAMDALAGPPGGVDPLAGRGFLASVADPDAEITTHEGVGLGTDVIVTTPSTLASALTWQGTVVHLAIFPCIDAGGGPRPRDPRSKRFGGTITQGRANRGAWFHA